MKTIKLLGVLVFLTSLACAQTPKGMNYQAVARNATGAILASQNISVRIAVTNGSGDEVLYQETHSLTTNQFGLFTLNIGNGIPARGLFSAIPWSTTTPWLQVELDPAGGTNYILMGSSQLMSVPYSIHSENTSGIQSVPVSPTPPSAGEILKFDGNQWAPFSMQNWVTNGNSATDTAIDFIGTTDNKGLMFRTNNIKQMYLSTNGRLGIGTTAPAFKLDVKGSGRFTGTLKVGAYTLPSTDGTNGQILKTNGTGTLAWSADNNSGGTVTTIIAGTGLSGDTITGSGTINAKNTTALWNANKLQGRNIITTAPANGQVLKYNTTTTQWEPSADNGTTYTAGTGISFSGNVINSVWTKTGNNISNNNTGNVGIGTSSPSNKITVIGNDNVDSTRIVRFLSSNSAQGISIGRNSIAAVGSDADVNINIKAKGTGGYVSYFTNNTEQIRLNNQGDLELFGNNSGTFSTGVLRFGFAGGEGIGSNRSSVGNGNLNGLDFYTGNQKRVSITDNGFVGIGTVLPYYDLHINNSGTNAAIKFTNSMSGNTSLDGTDMGTFGNNFAITNWENGSIFFSTNALQRGAIDPAGNFGVGTTSPSAKLHVQGNVKIVDGTEGDGKVLTSDANGLASWKALVACSAGNCCGTTSNDTILPSSNQTIVFKHEIYDDGGNNYDPVTGIFTVPSAGIYNCSAVLLMERIGGSSSAYENLWIVINKNNIAIAGSQSYYHGGNTRVGFSISMDFKFEAGDNIEFKLLNFSTTKFELFQSDPDERMSIHLVR